MIPVDEPHTGAVACGRPERVRSPQVAVQERVRSPRFLQDLCPPGSVRERGVQPIEQTISYAVFCLKKKKKALAYLARVLRAIPKSQVAAKQTISALESPRCALPVLTST